MVRSPRRKIQASADAYSGPAVKPEPPADLWAQLDKACAEQGFRNVIQQPPDTITAKGWAAKSGISYSIAKHRLLRLYESGKVEIAGYGPSGVIYYRIKK